MNKSDLAKSIALSADLPKKTAEDVVNTIFDSLSQELSERAYRDTRVRKLLLQNL